MALNYELLLYIFSALISLCVFWRLAKDEGFINENIFDLYIFIGLLSIVLKFVFRFGSEEVFLGCLLILFLFIKIKRWSFKKVGDVAIIPFVLFLYLISAFSAFFKFSGTSLLLFGILGLLLGLLIYLRSRFFVGVSSVRTSSARTKMPRYFGTFLNGVLFYLGLLLISLIAIIFLARFSLIKTLVFSVVFLFSLWSIIMEAQKDKNSKLVKERFADKIKERLIRKERELEKEEKTLEMEDSYMVPGRDSDNAEVMSDVDEDIMHEVNESSLTVLRKAKAQIKRALARFGVGRYGICEVCKQKIDPARLKAYPEATFCLKCSDKLPNKR